MYTLAIVVVVLLLILGFITVERHAPLTSTGTITAWEGALDTLSYAIPEYTTAGHEQEPTAIAQPSQNLAWFSYNPEPSATIAHTITNTDYSFNIKALIGLLSGSSQSATASVQPISPAVSSGAPSYALPDIAATPTGSGSARSEDQQALYDYANTAGAYLRSYEQSHSDDTTVINNYFKDRGNSSKTASLRQLGAGLRDVGTSLKRITHVPEPIALMHEALAQSYIDMGERLGKVPSTSSDTDLIQAINDYDAAADIYVKQYAAIITTLSSYGVTFGTGDAGSVFSYASAQAL